MISALSKKRPAISATCISTTAPMAKFGAITPPSFRSAQPARSASTVSASTPVVPITGRTRASSAASTRRAVAEALVKSTTTSGWVPVNSSAGLGVSG